MSEPVRRRRRWFALSVRGMLVLVLVVGVLAGWKARRAHRQRRAVAAIQFLQGKVVYDWQPRPDSVGGGPRSALGHPPGPPWLRRILGDEYFQEVVEVADVDTQDWAPGLGTTPSADAPWDGPEWQAHREAMRRYNEAEEARKRDQLACLDGLDRLETLQLVRTSLNAEGLARLGRLTSLRELIAFVDPIDAAGLAEVAKLSHLERLHIKLRLADAAPLALLERLPRLRQLILLDDSAGGSPIGSGVEELGVPITDAWLARLGRLGPLTHLSLNYGPKITDAGLAHLAHLERLRELELAGSPEIGDAGLAHLGRLANLEKLILSSATKVSDAGVAHLSGLANLEQLMLHSATRVTDAGVAHLESHIKLNALVLAAASGLTDASVDSLARLTGLAGLGLNVQSMTEAGIARLDPLRRLQLLVLTGARVRGEVLDGLTAANPSLELKAERIEPDEGAGDAPAPQPPDAPK